MAQRKKKATTTRTPRRSSRPTFLKDEAAVEMASVDSARHAYEEELAQIKERIIPALVSREKEIERHLKQVERALKSVSSMRRKAKPRSKR